MGGRASTAGVGGDAGGGGAAGASDGVRASVSPSFRSASRRFRRNHHRPATNAANKASVHGHHVGSSRFASISPAAPDGAAGTASVAGGEPPSGAGSGTAAVSGGLAGSTGSDGAVRDTEGAAKSARARDDGGAGGSGAARGGAGWTSPGTDVMVGAGGCCRSWGWGWGCCRGCGRGVASGGIPPSSGPCAGADPCAGGGPASRKPSGGPCTSWAASGDASNPASTAQHSTA